MLIGAMRTPNVASRQASGEHHMIINVSRPSGPWALLPRKGNIRHPFLLKPAHHKREPAFWALGIVFYLTRRRGHP